MVPEGVINEEVIGILGVPGFFFVFFGIKDVDALLVLQIDQ